MKELIDESEVSARSYYFLLDWNERDEHETIHTLFGTYRLCDLTIYQYRRLFEIAVGREIDELNKITPKLTS